MEDAILTVLAIVGIAIGLAALVIPFVALGLAVSAGRRLGATERRLAQAEHELAGLRYEVGRQAAQLAQARFAPPPPAPVPAGEPALAAPPLAARPVEPVAAFPSPTVSVLDTEAPRANPGPDQQVRVSPTAPLGAPVAFPAMAREVLAAPPAPPPPPPSPLPVESPASLEERLGLTWLTRIGAAAFVLGALFFFKYAVDSEWIGPAGRVAVGGLVGAGLVVFAELTATRSKASFVQSLTGVGLAVLFVATWASSVLYGLVSVTVAFLVSGVWLLLGAGLAFRRKGEAILVLTLAAGLANPIILSTGEDRPLALFGYLFLVTTVVLSVATELGFRLVPWLCVVGTTALFGGWYDRYFDLSDRRTDAYLDLPPESLVGAYHELGVRVVPLVAVLGFGAQWTVAALRGHQRSAPRGGVLTLALAGLSLAHGGAVLLFPDSPLALAGIALALAAGSLTVLGVLEAGTALVVPLGVASVALLVVASEVPEASRVPFVALLGLWAAVYVVGFLRGGGGARASELLVRGVPAKNGILATAALGVFALLGCVVLGEHAPTAAAVLVAVATAASAGVARLARLALLWVAAVGGSLLLLLVCAALAMDTADAPLSAGVLVVAALWGVVVLGGSALLVRSEDAAARVAFAPIAAASLGVLGFLGVALVATEPQVPTLRALLTAAAGFGALGFGLWLGQEPARQRTLAPVLLGQALGLFAAAVAFGLEGAPVTVLWAILGVVAAAISVRSGERIWRGTAALLFGAAVLRFLAVDVGAAEAQLDLWVDSRGREGLAALPAFFNPRAYACFGVGVALLAGALVLRRGDAEARFGAAVAAISGYALWLALAITETRAAFTVYPPLPTVPLDDTEWWAFHEGLRQSLAEQAGSLSMGTTLVLGVTAIVLLAAGFAARSALHRGIGLALFLATVGKLAAWDIFQLERLYQIVTLTGVGALLIGGGFLYARFGKRLVGLIREEEPGGTASGKGPGPVPPLVVLAMVLLGRPAEAAPESVDVGHFETTRALLGIGAPGDYQFEVDADLYRATRSSTLLGDLRILGPGGAEVPYALVDVASPPTPSTAWTTVLDPGELPGGALRATFEVPGRISRHGCLELDVRGDGFLRRVRVETGEGPAPELVVAEGAFVYRVHQPEGSVEHLRVRYPLSAARFVRITLLANPAFARDETALRFEGARVGCFEGLPPPEPPQLEIPLHIESRTRDAATQSTVLLLDAGAEGVPLTELTLEIATPELERRVEIGASSFRGVFPEVGGGVIYRVRPRDGLELSSLRLPLTGTRKRWLRVTIFDGDSAPLDVTGARAGAPRRQVRLRATEGGSHEVLVGAPSVSGPSYDLGAVLARSPRDGEPRPATLGPSGPNPRRGEEPSRPELPWTERHRTLVGGVLGVVLSGLSLWLALRLRRGA